MYQIKSLISIIGQKESLSIYGNNFNNSTSLKGLMNIEMSGEAPLIIYGNIFINNSALIEANVINVRKLNLNNLMGRNYTTLSDL